MPMTKAGQSTMSKFISRYGKQGKAYFYGKAVKDKNFAKAMGEMSVHNRAMK